MININKRVSIKVHIIKIFIRIHLLFSMKEMTD